MSFVIQILKVLWGMRPAHSFWQIWITITAAAAICVAVAVRPGATEGSQNATERRIDPILKWRQDGRPRAVAALTLLAVFLVCYIAMTLVWEDFAYYDDSQLTSSVLQGRDFATSILRASGRFVPLGLQEFNLIRHFTDTAIGYHVLPIVQLLVFSCILLVLDGELSVTARANLTILALLTPSILISFSGLIYDERDVLFFLVCLMLCVKKFEQSGSIAWAVAAAVCAQIMIYYKETAFLLLLGFAAGRLLLRCRSVPDAGWDYGRLRDKESRLDLCLASLAVLFLLYYVVGMGLFHYFEDTHGTEIYGASRRLRLSVVVTEYIKLDLLAWLFVVVVLGRIYLILRHRVAPSPFWDGLAFGGVACFIAYLCLRIITYYYLAPVDLIAVLYVGRFAVLSWPKMHSWSKGVAMMLASTFLLQNFVHSAWEVFHRKNVIHENAEIASVVETRYKSGAGNDLRLYFPFSHPYVIMEFAAYLNYRGVPVEGASGKAAGPNSIVLATPAVAKDGHCDWMTIICHAASGPAPGDLVIVLPDDEASVAEASVYRERGELLFSYEPFPPIPHRLYSLSLVTGKIPPDRWMEGSVTLWK